LQSICIARRAGGGNEGGAMMRCKAVETAKPQRTIGRTACVLFALAAPVAWHAAPVRAQTRAAPASGARQFAIPAGTLTDALTVFGQQSGLQVSVDAGLVRGITTPGVAGTLSSDQALARLLAGTGLGYAVGDGAVVTLYRLPPGRNAGTGPLQLAPLRIEGRDAVETADGPIQGYTAHRSRIGTKTDTPILETPQSISVVTRDQIVAQNPQTVAQALRYTAGIEAESRAAFTGFDFVYGRGFVLDRYLDGMKLQGADGYITPNIDIYNLERIEVLRGPSSVLYGQASPAGLVNFVSKRPTAEPLHEIMLQAGNYDNFEAAFDFGGPVDRDAHWLYRLTGIGHTTHMPVDFNKSQRLAIAPSVTWTPDVDTTLTVLTDFQYDPHVGLYNFVPADGSVRRNPNGRISRSLFSGDPDYNRLTRMQYSLGYQFDHRFNQVWSVHQNVRFMHVAGHLRQALPLELLADRRTLFRYAARDDEHLGALTVDNQAEARFDSGPVRHTVLVGFDYQRTTFDQRLGQDLGPDVLDIFDPVYHHTAFPPPALVVDADQLQRQYGLYIQDQLRYGRWSLLLGGRQDWARSDTDDRLAGARSHQSDHKFSWRAGVVYRFDQGVAPYFSYTTSFHPQAGTDANSNPFKPTTAQQYEVGVKYQPTGFNSFITLAMFQLTQQHVPTTDPDNLLFQVQTGEIRSRGIELEAHANLAPGFNLIGSYGYSNPVVTKANDGSRGKMPVNVPRNIASLWGDYAVQAGPFVGLGFGLGIRHIGRTYGDSANTEKIPGHVLVDAMVSYDMGSLSRTLVGWRLAINASNLLDKRYVSECTNDNCLYGLRRAVLGTVRYAW
jgi:iron complex outermembrane receptor protein